MHSQWRVSRWLLLGGATALISCFAANAPAIVVKEVDTACPHCGTRAKATITEGRSLGNRLDLPAPLFGFSPKPSLVCVHCGLARSLQHDPWSDEELPVLRQLLQEPEYQFLRSDNPWIRYVHCLERVKRPQQQIIEAYLVGASWRPDRQPRGDGKEPVDSPADLALDRILRDRASNALEARIERFPQRDSEWFMTAYLLVELNRRAGRFDAARRQLHDLADHFNQQLKVDHDAVDPHWAQNLHFQWEAVSQRNHGVVRASWPAYPTDTDKLIDWRKPLVIKK
jgi:hypothetical protein